MLLPLWLKTMASEPVARVRAREPSCTSPVPPPAPPARLARRSPHTPKGPLDVTALDVPGAAPRHPDGVSRRSHHAVAGGDLRPPFVRFRRPAAPVHPEDRGDGHRAGARRRAAVHLHGRHVRAVRHRQPAVRRHPDVDPAPAGRHGCRHHPDVRDLCGNERGGRRHRDRGRAAGDTAHAALRLQQGPHLGRHLRRRRARHHHSAVGARRGHRSDRAGRRRQDPARHVHPGLHAGRVLHHLHRDPLHHSPPGRSACSARGQRADIGPEAGADGRRARAPARRHCRRARLHDSRHRHPDRGLGDRRARHRAAGARLPAAARGRCWSMRPCAPCASRP